MNRKYEDWVSAHRAVDGDTVVVVLDLGYGFLYGSSPAKPIPDVPILSVRIKEIDAPEVHKTEQKAAALVVKGAADWWLSVNAATLKLVSFEIDKEKFGRVLGDFFPDAKPTETLSQFLLQQGLARKYLGGAKPPWLPQDLQRIAAWKGPI